MTNYEIKNSTDSLVLRLQTTIPDKEYLVLSVELNDSEWHNYNSSSYDDESVTFKINNSDFTIGDVLTDFKLVSSTRFLWNTTEGITILIDGEEVDTIHTNQYTVNYTEEGEHTIQAVYVGNNALNMSATDVKHFTVKQYPIEEGGEVPVTGQYKLEFVDKGLSTLDYGKHKDIQLRLTKNGVPVPDKVIETVTPTGIVTRLTSNAKGVVVIKGNENWDCGRYQIGGYFTEDSRNITKKLKWITINKAQSQITMGSGSFSKGDKIKFYFKSNNKALANTKVQIYVNGKAKDYTTSSTGVVGYQFDAKTTYKFKVVYKGDKNHESATFTTTITISE